MSDPNIVEAKMELGRWTIRVNGVFVMDFHRWREGYARRVAMRLADSLETARWAHARS